MLLFTALVRIPGCFLQLEIILDQDLELTTIHQEAATLHLDVIHKTGIFSILSGTLLMKN